MKKSCDIFEFWKLAKSRQADGELSAVRQLVELLILYPFYTVGPGFYQMAGFWKRQTPWSAKTGHLSPKAYRVLIEKMNPMPYRKISQNKLSEKAILSLLHIASTKYLGYFNELAGSDSTGMELRSIEDLKNFLKRFEDGKKICFKPLEGWAGQGFEIVEVRRNDNDSDLYRVKTQRPMTVDKFQADVIERQHKGSSIIEEFLKQHASLSALNPSSVNTMRLWVLRRPNGKPKVILGYLRVGREGSLVDNQSSGGIVAPIDLNTGKLNAAVDGLYYHQIFKKHPDHNAPIEGEFIPYFNESLDLAKKALAAFPGVRFAGLDIAVSESGPRVIEMNLSPDREGAAFTETPSKSAFSEALGGG